MTLELGKYSLLQLSVTAADADGEDLQDGSWSVEDHACATWGGWDGTLEEEDTVQAEEDVERGEEDMIEGGVAFQDGDGP